MNRQELLLYIKSVLDNQFIWGELDCTLFPAKCLDILVGKNLSKKHFGQWKDIKSAVRYSKENNLTLESWLIDNGCIEIEPNFQQTGDFLMIDTETINGQDWLSAAVCLGTCSAVCTENKIERVETKDINYKKILGVR